MTKGELRKCPRFNRYKKLHRGNFRIIRYCYNKDIVLYRSGFIELVTSGFGFYRWKTTQDLRKRLLFVFKKKYNKIPFYFRIGLYWSISHKTHKSRMGKGKGVVALEDWRARLYSGKSLTFIRKSTRFKHSSSLRLWRYLLISPISNIIISH